MRLGNCYLYAIRRYRERGGWIVLRRSTKARYIIHAQWGAAGLDVGAEPIGLWAGLRRIVGPDRGYLCWQRGRCMWRARIDALQIEEYLPPEWIDELLDRSRLARVFPAFAAIFRGHVRAETGEAPDSAEVIERTWPGGGASRRAAETPHIFRPHMIFFVLCAQFS